MKARGSGGAWLPSVAPLAWLARGASPSPPALDVFLSFVSPNVEVQIMRSLRYMLAKWCLLREI